MLAAPYAYGPAAYPAAAYGYGAYPGAYGLGFYNQQGQQQHPGMTNLNTAELQNAGWFDNVSNWVKGAVHKVEGVVHKYQGQACGAAAKLNPSLAKACNGAASALEKADGALNKKLMQQLMMMPQQQNPFMNLAEEPTWIDIDPEILVDEENNQVIAPV